jgi:hypothetical protein
VWVILGTRAESGKRETSFDRVAGWYSLEDPLGYSPLRGEGPLDKKGNVFVDSRVDHLRKLLCRSTVA